MSGRYSFRHALYQNVLYERIAEARRMRLHRLIGKRLETGYQERGNEIAAELAMHFERGHDSQQAIQYLHQAGENAGRKSAQQEAIDHLTKGLALLKTLPDTPERTRQELALQIALGASLQLTKGYASPKVEATYTRAREICRQVGDTPQLFPVLLGLERLYLARGQLQTARELREQLLALAQRLQDPGLLVRAYTMLAQTSYQSGEFVHARKYAEQGLALYDPQQHRSHVFLYGNDARVGGLSFASGALWYLGYPDQALQRSQEALAWAQELSHPFSAAGALTVAAVLHQRRREGQAVQQRAEAAMTLSTEQGFSTYLAVATILRGWALAEQGQEEEGIAQMRQGLAAHRATGAEQWQRYFLALLAEAYGKVGQPEEGLTLLAEALAAVNKTGQHDYEAELYRLKGELTLQSSVQRLESSVKTSGKSKVKSGKLKVPNPQHLTPSTQVEAEACFLRAIDIAQKQQAKSLELRAVMSLVRLRQQQASEHGAGSTEQGAGSTEQSAKRQERSARSAEEELHNTPDVTRSTQHEIRAKLDAARTMLSEVYQWFTEGFDTKDLQEAKTLLEELSH
jgi:predicted ATPase